MKKYISLALSLLLVACAPTVITVPATDSPAATPSAPASTDTTRVYNSVWQDVTPILVQASARALGVAQTLDEWIAEYNSTHTDDQLHKAEAETPIEEAPDVNIFIVNSATLEHYYEAIVSRVEFAERITSWRLTVEVWSDPITGQRIPCTLYVDNVPPEPPIIIPPQPRLWVALNDMTARASYYVEHFETEDAALHQYRMLCSQADLNNVGRGDGYGSPGDVWQAYIGDKEYQW